MNIKKPTFVVDRKKCHRNIKKMMKKVSSNNLSFRPHFKTHQSAEIGELFKEYNIDKITVSSVSMADYFAKNGWRDITIAFPVNIREIDKINKLAKSIDINLLILNRESVSFLSKYLKNKIRIFIEIDTGYHRSGIDYKEFDEINELVELVNNAKYLEFRGFLTHAGHTYKAKSKKEILEIHDQTIKRMSLLNAEFDQYNPSISIGNTPSCSISNNFENIDEIRPGNFIYYDIMQLNLNSCHEHEIAVALACPVVAKNSRACELVIYGGGVHLSKEYIYYEDKKIYGRIVDINSNNTWGNIINNASVSRLSQEHGIIKCEKKYFNMIKIGDIIGVLPVHSCMTANLMKDNTILL